MTEEDFKTRLENMADELPRNVLTGIRPLPFDKYVLMSGLQKSIRRGDAKLAVRFALSLWHTDKRALWRRLGVTAVEDIAMGAIDTVLDVVVACKFSTWRKGVGDAALGVHLAKRMAQVPKTRYLTELYLKGGIGHAPKTGKKLPVPDEIATACALATNTSHGPLMALLPAGWLEMQREEKHLRIQQETPVSSPECKGLPVYALDGLYTRPGIHAVKLLQAAVPGLKTYSPKQIGEGYFFIEAETLNPRLTSERWDAFRQDSIFAVMQSLGLDRDGYMALQRSLVKNYDIYNDIRLEKIAAMGAERQDLFSEGE